ncbi:MAG: isoprenylcysteine carboxylmethyltransferase family protein [Anderseniella sp.]
MTESAPNSLPWPPMIFGGLVIAGLGLHHVQPIGLPATLIWPGYAVLAAGIILDIWAMATMARARTNILPHRAAGKLVTSGPFALMRNPIYVGNTIATLGLGLALQNGWLLIATPLAALGVHKLAVVREQAHLRDKFGQAWTEYAGKVKAWWIV